jgi:hypothetical protein
MITENYEKELNEIQEYIEGQNKELSKNDSVIQLFRKLYKKEFSKETDEASGTDGYVRGRLLLELKGKKEDWCAGFFQACHYLKQSKSFSTVCVICNGFLGLWKLKDVDKKIHDIIEKSDAVVSPSKIGPINASKLNKIEKNKLKESAICLIDGNSLFNQNALKDFLERLQDLEVERLIINQKNFIDKIEFLKSFFDSDKPMDAIHCFYAIVNYWDDTSIVSEPDGKDYVVVSCQNGKKVSEQIYIKPKFQNEFKKFVDKRKIYTNHEEGLTTDYYFSRFDEVMTRIDDEYTKQHGIYFTDINLSIFALWFVHYYYEKKLAEKYIIFDPAAGSGNLVTSWRKNHLKFKIVSELEPDLLKIIERRMKDDPDHLRMGFTVVPKTNKNEGLNFIDKSAEKYLEIIHDALKDNGIKLDKPFAFLLNPPYKNTDERADKKEAKKANYEIDKSIIDFAGENQCYERYVAFLSQIACICLKQVEKNPNFEPLLMVFTPTSWLIPRPAYVKFRKNFDNCFKFERGFIIKSKEFFKLGGDFPISFTIWKFNKGKNNNIIKLKNLLHLKKEDLDINWSFSYKNLNKILLKIISGAKTTNFSTNKILMKKIIGQTMYDVKRDPTKKELESNTIYGGLPLKCEERKNKKTYGVHISDYIGLMDGQTPIRIKQDKLGRITGNGNNVWFRLDSTMADINKSQCMNAPNRNSYCAYDLPSAKKTFLWFCINLAFRHNGYPREFNQADVWMPKISKKQEAYFYSLCFAYVLSDNRCIITKFEKDNPVTGNNEIYLDNPLSTNSPNSFWNKFLKKEIVKTPSLANDLVKVVSDLYIYWNNNICKNDVLYNKGLEKETYFKYFDYADFLNKDSGLVQIKKYAEKQSDTILFEKFIVIEKLTKQVRDEIYNILVGDFKYFE